MIRWLRALFSRRERTEEVQGLVRAMRERAQLAELDRYRMAHKHWMELALTPERWSAEPPAKEPLP